MTSVASTVGERTMANHEGCSQCYRQQDFVALAEELLILFVVYCDKLNILYDTHPPLYSSSKENNAGGDSTQLFRNGGVLRILINSLMLLINKR